MTTSNTGSFPITSVSRDDFFEAGLDASKVDDETMRRIASKMADAYCDCCFWIALENAAEMLEIPTLPETPDEE